ncbi:MAG: cyclic nucleotide-binding domain-containing protein, partial [Chloroflexota bacterium]|nr:cyclic nucleotide-binding domain-containing protein [Chloroflexota bacterium]
TLPARLVAEDLLARVFGAKESLTALSVAVGSLVTPAAIDLLGVRGALAVLGLVAPALVALAWRRLQRIDASITHRDDEIAVLRQVAMLRVLPVPAIDSLALQVRHAEVDAGQVVFSQGDVGDDFYVITDGEADVIGDGRLIRTMGPGEAFGEIALLRKTTRTTTVQARTSLRLYALDGRNFVSMITGYPSSAREADALVVERLGTSHADR